MSHDVGRMGFGGVPGDPVEGYLFKNAAHGYFIADGTTGPAQLTGTGNGTFYYDNTAGIVVVDGTALDVAAAADTLLETAADIFDSGQSRIYTIIAWKNPSTGVVAIKVCPGTIALTAAIVPLTTAEIEAMLPLNAKWIALGQTTINRSADTTATQTATTNLVRPLYMAS